MILETWLREAFRNFDAIAAHLLPPLDAARIQTTAPIAPPEAEETRPQHQPRQPRMSESEPDPAAPAQPTVPDHWRAAISALPPEKRDAAWNFFQERGLHAAAARDTLSGLLLLMEANGLFMDACAKRVQAVMQQEDSAAPPPPVDSKRLTEELSTCNRNFGDLLQELRTFRQIPRLANRFGFRSQLLVAAFAALALAGGFLALKQWAEQSVARTPASLASAIPGQRRAARRSTPRRRQLSLLPSR